MAVIDVVDINRNKVSQIELNQKIFGAEVKEELISEVVRWQMAKRRSGTASTKIRSDVSGGGRKPWRQKGTGRARAGSSRSPLWRGGGVVFGPSARDYSFKLPKKVRKAALRSTLSMKVKEGRVIVVDDIRLEEIKTAKFVEILKRLGLESSLIVTAERDEILWKSSRNVPGVKVLPVEGLNVFDLLKYPNLVLLKASVEKIEKAVLS